MVCDEWVKVDALLQQKLTELQVLDQESDLIMAKAEQQGEVTPELKQAMNASFEKYKNLAKEIAALKATAKSLKA